MDLNTSTFMLIFFIGLFLISFWKIYAFLPNEQLSDDDNTPEAKAELLKIVLKVIQNSKPSLTLNELYEKVKNDESFDREHFWRFNPNKLHHLLQYYYAKHPDTQSIEDIYKKLNS
ncbi:hypothetical protein [Sulfurimonas marina]|uniref:Uncharacterized protein n=1 Tax=Sulfurimonas marina TaxID=2590551 RepID=A0A7M1AW81_9BACT|nr:hypothetical protein [Sulfurimonas marina]QOP40632.1 hypothetical protein FJR03_02285 [Sulfurimonas marina]